ncbi:MAG TPA: hypothetical protein VLY85_03775, partial [Thermoplasmata archaeon]|nr:hypothetical protein [Thermoplasmata archaeon]
AAAAVSEVSGPAERLAVSLRRYFPPGVTTLVLTPLADEEAVHLLPHLRRRGFPAFVLSPSPLPLLTASFPKDDRGADLVRRLMRLVRRQRISGAWEEAPVLDWEEYWSLGELRRFLSHPAASGRRH